MAAKAKKDAIYGYFKSLFRFHDENVALVSEYFLGENTETRGGALSNNQQIEVFLRHVDDPGFQTGVGEDNYENPSEYCL